MNYQLANWFSFYFIWAEIFFDEHYSATMVQNETMVALHSSKCDHGAATIMVYATIETRHC